MFWWNYVMASRIQNNIWRFSTSQTLRELPKKSVPVQLNTINILTNSSDSHIVWFVGGVGPFFNFLFGLTLIYLNLFVTIILLGLFSSSLCVDCSWGRDLAYVWFQRSDWWVQRLILPCGKICQTSNNLSIFITELITLNGQSVSPQIK